MEYPSDQLCSPSTGAVTKNYLKELGSKYMHHLTLQHLSGPHWCWINGILPYLVSVRMHNIRAMHQTNPRHPGTNFTIFTLHHQCQFNSNITNHNKIRSCTSIPDRITHQNSDTHFYMHFNHNLLSTYWEKRMLPMEVRDQNQIHIL